MISYSLDYEKCKMLIILRQNVPKQQLSYIPFDWHIIYFDISTHTIKLKLFCLLKEDHNVLLQSILFDYKMSPISGNLISLISEFLAVEVMVPYHGPCDPTAPKQYFWFVFLLKDSYFTRS